MGYGTARGERDSAIESKRASRQTRGSEEPRGNGSAPGHTDARVVGEQNLAQPWGVDQSVPAEGFDA